MGVGGHACQWLKVTRGHDNVHINPFSPELFWKHWYKFKKTSGIKNWLRHHQVPCLSGIRWGLSSTDLGLWDFPSAHLVIMYCIIALECPFPLFFPLGQEHWLPGSQELCFKKNTPATSESIFFFTALICQVCLFVWSEFDLRLFFVFWELTCLHRSSWNPHRWNSRMYSLRNQKPRAARLCVQNKTKTETAEDDNSGRWGSQDRC